MIDKRTLICLLSYGLWFVLYVYTYTHATAVSSGLVASTIQRYRNALSTSSIDDSFTFVLNFKYSSTNCFCYLVLSGHFKVNHCVFGCFDASDTYLMEQNDRTQDLRIEMKIEISTFYSTRWPSHLKSNF